MVQQFTFSGLRTKVRGLEARSRFAGFYDGGGGILH
jgi:hypothetical protein